MMTFQQGNGHNNNNNAMHHGTVKKHEFVLHGEEANADAVTVAETDEEQDDFTGVGDYESEEETQIAQAMVRAAFTKSASSPILNMLLRAAFQEEQAESNNKAKRLRAAMTKRALPLATSSRSFKKARHHGRRITNHVSSPVRMSISEPSLKSLTTNKKAQAPSSSKSSTKPTDKLQTLLLQAGYTYKTYSYSSLSTAGFFCKLSPEQISLYDTDLVRAVRDQDIDALKERLTMVPSLFAGNKFGETILHASCRRSALSIVQFLLGDAAHPIRVCCDYGRTVLHDAAWTCTPDFGIIDVLLEHCPDLLFVCDRRGFTALDYIPKEVHARWCDYLEQRGAHRLRPAILQ